MGLSVGCIIYGLSDEEWKVVYIVDVIYGINNEFGFDYFCDNMKLELDVMV